MASAGLVHRGHLKDGPSTDTLNLPTSPFGCTLRSERGSEVLASSNLNQLATGTSVRTDRDAADTPATKPSGSQ
jgi:hypothetical protein